MSNSQAACTFDGVALPKGQHQIRLTLKMQNQTEVVGDYTFTSDILKRPLPRFSSISLNSVTDWQAKFRVSMTPAAHQPALKAFTWYVDGDARGIGASRSKNNFDYSFDSTWIKNGNHAVKIELVFSDGQIVKLSKNINVRLLPPPPPTPKVVWNYNLKTSAWKSGSIATVGGKILTSGTMAKTVQLRAWDARTGWTYWRTANVSKTGYFETKFQANAPLKVQLQVPKSGRTPGTNSQTKVDVFGTVEVTAPTRVSPGVQVRFKVAVQPKWTGNLNCQLTIEQYDDYGRFVSSGHLYPVVKVTGGYGIFNAGAREYRHSQVTLACSVDWYGMVLVDGGTGWATVRIY
jgi:hypothetical protein